MAGIAGCAEPWHGHSGGSAVTRMGRQVDSFEFSPVAGPDKAYRLRLLWLVSTAGIALLIGVLTLAPTVPMPPGELPFDKIAHALAFMALVIPTAALWPRLTVWVGLAAVLYGGLIEVVQPYAGRTAEVADLLADGAGVVLGVILGMGFRLAFARRRARRPVRHRR